MRDLFLTAALVVTLTAFYGAFLYVGYTMAQHIGTEAAVFNTLPGK